MKEFNKDIFNKLCAEFINGKYVRDERLSFEPKGRWYIPQFPDANQNYNLKFDSDWNWIMEVVTKIHQQLKPDSSLKQDLIRRVGVVDKEKTVEIIWEFLNNISKYIYHE